MGHKHLLLQSVVRKAQETRIWQYMLLAWLQKTGGSEVQVFWLFKGSS